MLICASDEDLYENALDFVPERWFSKPEMIKNKDAFIPFSIGPYGCIGKNRECCHVFGQASGQAQY